MSNFVKAFTKIVAQRKTAGDMKQEEGKLQLYYKAYVMLCEKALQSGNTHIHFYLISQWNLMVRTSSVQCLNYQFINWSDDAMTIKVPMSKSDQTGERAFAKHVYANPITPATCIVLSLGIHLLCSSYFQNGDFRIFPQDSISSTFSQWLKHTANTMTRSENDILGISTEDLGTHSIRKGACTYASGQQCSPSAIAIKLRMDHSLGETFDRYYFESDGADQLLGRFISGLCFTKAEFGTLPPHYNSNEFEKNIVWENIVPYYNQYPIGFKTTIPYLIASVIYHLNYLNEILPVSHPFFKSVFYTNKLYDQFNGKIITGIGKCIHTGLQATGMPAHHLIAEEVRDLKNTIKNFADTLHDELKVTLPNNLKNMLMNHFEINGAAPLSKDDLYNCVRELENRMMSHMSTSLLSSSSSTSSSSSSSSVGNPDFDIYYWSGRYHHVPQNFKIPDGNVKTLWNLYHFGDKSKRISPYKNIIPKFDFENNNIRKTFSDLNIIIKEVDNQIINLPEHYNLDNVLLLSVEERDNIFLVHIKT